MFKRLILLIFATIPEFLSAANDPFADVKHILIVGNSLSRHHLKPSIGWNNLNGMAATSPEKDYVHTVIRELDRLYPGQKHTYEIIRLKSEAKMRGTKHLVGKKADLIIFQHGENYRGKEQDLGRLYAQVIAELKKGVTPNIICVGAWSLNPKKGKARTEILKKAAESQQVYFVDISSLNHKEYSAWMEPKFAKASNGVKWHPSDKGMKEIAKRILKLSPRYGKPVPAKVERATISIDANKITGPVNRKIFGQMVSGADGQYIWSSDKPDVSMRRTGWGLWNPKTKSPESIPTKLIKALRPGVVRYPGGSAVKNFDWKATVGPYEKREPNWRWGLMEYLQWCKEINTEPQLCLSSYKGTPEDQRDLIEFLNLPAVAKYPWAMKRAEYGHKAPYNVKYIELGNEPFDGNRRAKPAKQWSVKGYIDWALKTTELIRKTDPSVKIGLPLWITPEADKAILEQVAPKVDYIIHHTYSVQYAGNLSASKSLENRIAMACMAAPEQFEYNLKKYNKEIRNSTGRKLPIAITEYNASIKSSKPYIYRKSLAAGIFCIDYAFRMMKPENNILLANYWQIYGGYWGSIVFKNGKINKLYPPYFCYRIIGDNILDKLVAANVECPTIDFEGFCAVKPASGSKHEPTRKLADVNLAKYAIKKILNIDKKQVDITKENGIYKINLKTLTRSHYPNFLLIDTAKFPAQYRPDATGLEYKFSYEAKWIDSKKTKSRVTLGVGIMDARGWSKAGSAIGVDGAEAAVGKWKQYSGIYKPLKDTQGLAILARIKGGLVPTTGTLLVKNITVEPWRSETFPAYPALSVMATKSSSNKALTLFVINKSTDRLIRTKIILKNFASAETAKLRIVDGACASTDSGVKIREAQPVTVKDSALEFDFPPHSITAVILNKRD